METADRGSPHYLSLAAYRRCTDQIQDRWPEFIRRRRTRLKQGLFDAPVEKIAENIVEDLLTDVLDWPLECVNLQIGRADMVLSTLGIKRIVIEVKRPGTLAWQRTAIDAALDQARRYADSQCVGAIAVSDGQLLYAADLLGGNLRDRVLVSLDATDAPLELWWLSVDGIYRPCPAMPRNLALLLPADSSPDAHLPDVDTLLHPKYRLPAHCFGYVGSPRRPHTWKLPFLTAVGTPDTKRLPKAIQAILSNYRGARVEIPRDAVADVLVRLASAAATLRKLPCQCSPVAEVYAQAHEALTQLDRVADVGCCTESA